MDEEGMVYSLDDGARTVYFCDRFRRYKFVGEAGALALLQGMCTKNDANLEANASLFSKDEAEAAQQRAEGYALYEEKPNLRRRDRRQIGTWSDEECERTAILVFCCACLLAWPATATFVVVSSYSSTKGIVSSRSPRLSSRR